MIRSELILVMKDLAEKDESTYVFCFVVKEKTHPKMIIWTLV